MTTSTRCAHPELSTTPATRRRRTRALRSSAFAALAITAGLLGSACSQPARPEAIKPSDRPTTTVAVTQAASRTSTTSVASNPPVDQTVQVVRSDHDLEIRDTPDASAPSRTLATKTEFGTPISLLVTDATPGWVQVLVPGRPTGATAWLESEGIELRPVTTEIQVDLAARTLTLLDAGEVVLTTPVAVGSPDSPTPTGRFSLTDKLQSPNPDGAYGPFALGLSGRSEVLTDFAGGDGQIGIHGTDDPSSIGRNVSHGCIRVPNDVIDDLNRLLPLGTPVVVR